MFIIGFQFVLLQKLLLMQLVVEGLPNVSVPLLNVFLPALLLLHVSLLLLHLVPHYVALYLLLSKIVSFHDCVSHLVHQLLHPLLLLLDLLQPFLLLQL